MSAVGICLGLAVACGGSLPHPPYIAQPTEALVVVATLPPPARVEFVPPKPGSGAVWVDGEWMLKRGRWAWKLGRWWRLPEGVRYSPWALVRASDGTIYIAPGILRGVDGKPVEEPPPLAVATADSVAVVEPDGLPAVTGRTLKPMERPAEKVPEKVEGVGERGPEKAEQGSASPK